MAAWPGRHSASLGHTARAAAHVVHIMDREGDIHEVFARVQSLGHGAIIRRYRNRSVAEGSGDADETIWQAPLWPESG